jgi:hypothetical protein
MAVADELLISPTQKRMLALLSDRQWHSSQDLHACLSDELTPISNIAPHLHHLRRALRSRGQDVISQRLGGKPYYLLIDAPALSRPSTST